MFESGTLTNKGTTAAANSDLEELPAARDHELESKASTALMSSAIPKEKESSESLK